MKEAAKIGKLIRLLETNKPVNNGNSVIHRFHA